MRDEFFSRLVRSSRSLLLLDYDGTLAPFTPDRARAFPYPGVQEVIEKLIEGRRTRVVIVSGREAREVASLLGAAGVEVFGSHGLVRRSRDGSESVRELPLAARQGLDEARRVLTERGHTERIEEKTGCVAVHWRGLDEGEREIVQKDGLSVLEPLALPGDLVLRPFDGGLELRVREATKAGAVTTVLAEEREGIVAAYLGDDYTDEDAFLVLRGRGLPVLVREDGRSSQATCRIRSHEEVLLFLEDWARAVEEDRGTGTGDRE
jgi:trehalose-phosphatase